MHINRLNLSKSKYIDASPDKLAQQEKLKKATQEFESLFLNNILSEMRKSMPKSNLFGDSSKQEMYYSMLDQERAKQWSKNGGIGLAKLLYEQLKNQM